MLRRRSHSAEYKAHLRSPEWRAIRRAALERAGFRCEFCNRAKAPGRPLQVHHRTYERLGHELPGDLTVLCGGRGGCHAAADRQRRLAAGRRPKTKRKRRRRQLSGPLRELRAVAAVLVFSFGGLKLAAIVLPHFS